MGEQAASQSLPAAQVPQGAPPQEQAKKRGGVLWLIVLLALLLLGSSGYVLYLTRAKPAQEVSVPQTPQQELRAEPVPSPATTPPLTSSDSLSDIEKDLTGTTIEAQGVSELDADLQNL